MGSIETSQEIIVTFSTKGETFPVRDKVTLVFISDFNYHYSGLSKEVDHSFLAQLA